MSYFILSLFIHFRNTNEKGHNNSYQFVPIIKLLDNSRKANYRQALKWKHNKIQLETRYIIW